MADNSHPNYFNYLLSFILGFIVISVAFISFDQTLVYLGSSSNYAFIMLLSILSGLFLGFFLSFQFENFLQKNIKIILIFSAIWLSIVISKLYFIFLAKHLLPNAAFSTFLITGPFAVFITVGILFGMAFFKKNNKPVFLLTFFLFGMIISVVIAEIVSLSFFSGSWVLFLNCCLLIACAMFLMKNFLEEIITSSLIIATVVIAFGINIQINANSIFIREYQAMNDSRFIPVALHASIVESLFPTSSLASALPAKNQYPYLPLIRQILAHDSQAANQSVLVLGTGIYQFAKLDNSKIHFTYLDDARNTLPSACTYLSILSKGNNLVVGKEHSLAKQTRKFNVVIANVFPNNQAITPMLLSYQHFSEIRDALSDDGTAIINVLARPTLSDLYSKRVDNTIRAVFPSCMGIPLAYDNQLTNIVYVCQKSGEERDNTIYTSEIH